MTEREVTYFVAMIEMSIDEDPKSDLFESKLSAFSKAKTVVDAYAKEGIREDLLNMVLKKKLELIRQAKTAENALRAAKPPKPSFNYGKWRDDSLHSAEEELVLWSIVSPNHNLIVTAKERYMALFKIVFGAKAEDILSFPGNAANMEV